MYMSTQLGVMHMTFLHHKEHKRKAKNPKLTEVQIESIKNKQNPIAKTPKTAQKSTNKQQKNYKSKSINHTSHVY